MNPNTRIRITREKLDETGAIINTEVLEGEGCFILAMSDYDAEFEGYTRAQTYADEISAKDIALAILSDKDFYTIGVGIHNILKKMAEEGVKVEDFRAESKEIPACAT